jgi:hypothetical protein
MKTDDYKQELRISATLRRTNTKKYFAFKKIARPPQKASLFSRVAAGRLQIIAPLICVHKKRPSLAGAA